MANEMRPSGQDGMNWRQRLVAGFKAVPRWKQVALAVVALVALAVPLNTLRHYSGAWRGSPRSALVPEYSKHADAEEGTGAPLATPALPAVVAKLPPYHASPEKAGWETQPAAAPDEESARPTVELASTGWGRLVIRNASAGFTVKEINEAQQRIVQIADSLGGYVASANIQQPEKTGRYKPPATGTMELRVPNDRFTEAINALRSIGRMTALNVTSQDVSEEYVDLDSRLRHWRAQERLVLEMLNKTARISDMLSVRNELSTIQQQIETITGRLRYLSARVAMASITVSISERVPPPAKPKKPTLIGKISSEGKRLKAAFRGSVEDFIVVATWVCIVLVNVIWYVALAAIVFVIYKRAAPRRRAAEASGQPPTATV